jgi:hypothetical protein
MDRETMHLTATGPTGQLTLYPVIGVGLFLAMPQ